jgi:hypothetical protein
MIKYLNVVFFGGMIMMNYLANVLPLNNKTTGQLADNYPNLFVPAGITFSIWGVIYILLAIYCVVQFTGNYQAVVSEISLSFAVSCLLNALWIVFWHYERLPLSLVTMIALLITLIYINTSLTTLPPGILKASFGIYLGWICIAAIANVTALLVHYKWTGFGVSEETWTIIMILVGSGIAALTLYKLRNPFIGLSVIWAFTGIIIKRLDDYRQIVITSTVAISVVGMLSLWGFFRNYNVKSGKSNA